MNRRHFLSFLPLATLAYARAAEPGLRVFFTGNSFHMRMVELFPQIVEAAGIKGHTVAGTMLLGGSRAITLWEKPDAENPAKAALASGAVDVLTLCPWRQIPDPGVEALVDLAVKHNAKVRVTIQELWMAFDRPKADNPHTGLPKEQAPPTPWDDGTAQKLRAIHADYFAALDAQIGAVNKKHGRAVLACVPSGHACIALREQIRLGKAPGLARQADLFTDTLGHPGYLLSLLNAYGHFAVIYRRSPVGLAAPREIRGIAEGDREPLARLLQQLAWEAVTSHPLSGITKNSR